MRRASIVGVVLVVAAAIVYVLRRDVTLYEFPSRSEQLAAVGKVIRDCSVCPELVVLPQGSFLMGASEQDRDIYLRSGGSAELAAAETPAHRVDIAYTLAFGRYEITWDEYDKCVRERECPERYAGTWGRGRNPAIHVSWDDVTRQYLPWLNKKAGLHDKPTSFQYRLPTEGEWEYAARAGTTTAFSFGDSIDSTQANYDGKMSYNNGQSGEFRQKPLPVGRFQANPFGLYDMHGNVAEWVQDAWHENYQGAPSDGSAREGGMSFMGATVRAVRGGTWLANPGALRSAFRGRTDSTASSFSIGFRVVRTIPIAGNR